MDLLLPSSCLTPAARPTLHKNFSCLKCSPGTLLIPKAVAGNPAYSLLPKIPFHLISSSSPPPCSKYSIPTFPSTVNMNTIHLPTVLDILEWVLRISGYCSMDIPKWLGKEPYTTVACPYSKVRSRPRRTWSCAAWTS